jgi:hypothetical protein
MEEPGDTTRQVDSKGRLTLGAKFAGRTVIVREIDETEIAVKLARVVPEREAWLYQNPVALAMLRAGLAESKAGAVAPSPDLATDAIFAKKLANLPSRIAKTTVNKRKPKGR